MKNETSIEELFSQQHDVDSFSDAIFEATNVQYSKQELMEIFEKLPRDIRFTAYQWSLSDSVFRDDAYDHIKKHGIES